jgi:heme A synthase
MLARVRNAFRWLTSVLFALVVVQVGLAGVGAFSSLHKAKKAPVSKKSVEDAFGAHGIVGTVIVLVMLLLLLAAVAGRLGDEKIRWSGALFALGILQFVLGVVSPSAPAVGFLHGVNALAICAVAALLAHRTWTAERRTMGAAAAP